MRALLYAVLHILIASWTVVIQLPLNISHVTLPLYEPYFMPAIIDSAIYNDNNTIDMPVKLIYVPEFSL
jgi:hypothetical protein